MDVADLSTGTGRRRAAWRHAGQAALLLLVALFALTLGYDGLWRVQGITNYAADCFDGWSYLPPVWLPRLPPQALLPTDADYYPAQLTAPDSLLAQLSGSCVDCAAGALRVWRARRTAPDSRIFYAYHAAFLGAPLAVGTADGEAFEAAMRRGEALEPDNALYPLLLAHNALSAGMRAGLEQPHYKKPVPPDQLLDRAAFKQGIRELWRAMDKPYLRTYGGTVAGMKLRCLPQPVLTEQYMDRLCVAESELQPWLSRFRSIARKLPGCARLLMADGCRRDAEAVMDFGVRYARLLLKEPCTSISEALVDRTIALTVTRQGAAIYAALGRPAKAAAAQAAADRLILLDKAWKPHWAAEVRWRAQASLMARLMQTGYSVPTAAELAPGRMHEHVLAEEAAASCLLVLLGLALLGTLAQGMVWHLRMRDTGAPLLLQPPAPVLIRALGLGVVLPLVVYWLYARLPEIGGREFAVFSTWWPRFTGEWLAVAILVLWLPQAMVRRQLRRQAIELGLEMPEARAEAALGWWIGGAVGGAAAAIAGLWFCFCHYNWAYFGDPAIAGLWTGTALMALLAAVACVGVGRRRRRHGCYFGMLARSLAPLYAGMILALALTAGPWLLHEEARWLRRDTLLFNHLGDPAHNGLSLSSAELRATRQMQAEVRQALEGE